MRPSSTLSSSALNYLESLERNSKALRGNAAPIKKDEKTTKPGTAPAPVKRRESISDIISQARRQTSLARTDSDDFDVLNESLKSSIFDGSVSTDTDSEESTTRILPLGTPGQQVGRKSLKEIRELRNSIDQSLVKPPESMMSRAKAGEDPKKKTHFESIKEEIAEDLPKTPVPSKSPFKKAIQSGSESSDAESIVFDEVFEEVLPSPPRKPAPVATPLATKKVVPPPTKVVAPEPKKVKKKAKSESSPSSSSSSSSSESESESDSKSSKSSESSKTTSKATDAPNPYDDDFESEKSSSSTVKVTEKPKSKVKMEKVNVPAPGKPSSPIPYEDFIPKPSSESEESSKSTVKLSKPLEEKLKEEKMEHEAKKDEKKAEKKEGRKEKKDDRKKRSSSSSAYSSSFSSSSSSVEQEEERTRDRERRRKSRGGRSRERRRKDLHTCQNNIHNVIESVVKTHVQMLDEFNRLEHTAVSQWTAAIKRFENDDSPNSRKLQEIIRGRLNRNFSM